MKKTIPLFLVLVICLSLCACGQCNCGCCENAAAVASEPTQQETVPEEIVPEEIQTQEEYLTELLTSERWVSLDRYLHENVFTYYYSVSFLSNGYGLEHGRSNVNDSKNGKDYIDKGDAFQWILDGDKLLTFEVEALVNGSDKLYTFEEERNIFVCKYAHTYPVDKEIASESILVPESRINEFIVK